MSKINVLDKHVAELIAAGEVVERPSSVIKELVENSIDAGATSITVEIKNGGTSFMRVTDNGCGIEKDDIKIAFLRHATSKVKLADDLDSISTLGFRGEALSSISSVSHLELITKTKADEIGTRYVISGGEEISFEDAGCPDGTTFIIRDLFYNIPARMKFLKTDVAEGNAVSNVMDKIALSHPEISFVYIKDSKTVLKTTGDSKLLSSIYAVYGRDFAHSLIEVDYELNGVKVSGYISKPENSRPNRNMQNFFINGRYVISKTAMAALQEACKGYVMVGKFPSCVLNLQMSFEAVDVNVHPTKLEVRFVNERPVFDAVYHAVKTALIRKDKPKNATFNGRNTPVNPFELAKKVFRERDEEQKPQIKNESKPQEDVFSQLDIKTDSEKKSQPITPISFSQKVSDSANPFDIYSKEAVKKEKSVEKVIENTPAVTKPAEETVQPIVEEKEEIKPLVDVTEDFYSFVGEAFKTYIIIEKNEKELILIDKHAAHERLIFEKLKKEKGAGFSQLLLEPISVTLNKIDYNSVINNLDAFSEVGFDVEDFGNGVVLVRSAPQYLDSKDIEETVIEMAGYLTENKKEIKSEKMEWIYHNVSCRAAVKAGNKSSREELISLAKELQNNPTLTHCPHGRPVCIVIKKREIEKQFGRV
ncbi:MAG: DNA mismatch repair endonuclease MutL [Oscillospiraceae bacterium]|nr:DNA mismatch repair endonuclease MutL [Candidatus Ruminococcus equi]